MHVLIMPMTVDLLIGGAHAAPGSYLSLLPALKKLNSGDG